MQHFGCPTRLLDWTASPFVATYFAVVDNLDYDGAVWAFDPVDLVDRTTQADVKATRDGFVASKDTRSMFWDSALPQMVHPFMLKKHHIRIATQQGCFTVCGRIPSDHGLLIDESGSGTEEGFGLKIVIEKDRKTDFLRNLARMNITASSLFPGVEGLGKSIKELIQLEISDTSTRLTDRISEY